MTTLETPPLPCTPVAARFRGFLPVVVDVETGGFNPRTDALLEIAVVLLNINKEGYWQREATHSTHVEPFPGGNLHEAALEFNRIDPTHPFRAALPEALALQRVVQPVHAAVRRHRCKLAILVGHNPSFDLSFVRAAFKRTHLKSNPFHSFSTFDTATLCGVAYGQTVLARGLQAAGLGWDEREAHSAIYDAEKTADLFCRVVNTWDRLKKQPRTD